MQNHQEQAQSKSQIKTICRNKHSPEERRVPGIEVKPQTSPGKMRDGCDRHKTRGLILGQALQVPGGRGRAGAWCSPGTLQTPKPLADEGNSRDPGQESPDEAANPSTNPFGSVSSAEVGGEQTLVWR